MLNNTWLISLVTSQRAMLRLFTGAKSLPAALDNAKPADFAEPKNVLYDPLAIAPADWVRDGNNGAAMASCERTFQLGGSTDAAELESIAGYFLVAADGAVIAAESFPDGPYQIGRYGGSVKVTAVLRPVG